jgi:hypothetical protein
MNESAYDFTDEELNSAYCNQRIASDPALINSLRRTGRTKRSSASESEGCTQHLPFVNDATRITQAFDSIMLARISPGGPQYRTASPTDRVCDLGWDHDTINHDICSRPSQAAIADGYFATRSSEMDVPIAANAALIWLALVSMKKLPGPLAQAGSTADCPA